MLEKHQKRALRRRLRDALTDATDPHSAVAAVIGPRLDVLPTIIELLRELAKELVPRISEEARLALAHWEPVLATNSAIAHTSALDALARDRELADALKGIGTLSLCIRENKQGPVWADLKETAVLGALPIRSEIPGGTRLKAPLRSALGPQTATIQFPSGIVAAVPVIVQSHSRPLPSNIIADSTMLGIKPCPLAQATQPFEADRRSDASSIARTLLARLHTLFESGYSHSQLADRLLDEYARIRDQAIVAHLASHCRRTLAQEDTRRTLTATLPYEEVGESYLRHHLKGILAALVPDAFSVQMTTTVRYDSATKTLACRVYYARQFVVDFVVRGNPPWLPQFLEDLILRSRPSHATDAYADEELIRLITNQLASLGRTGYSSHLEQLLGLARTLHNRGLDHQPIMRRLSVAITEALADSALDRTSTSLTGRLDQARKYLRVYLQLTFGDNAASLRMSLEGARRFDRLGDFIGLCASGRPRRPTPVSDGFPPLAPTVSLLVAFQQENDLPALKASLDELRAISRDLNHDVITALASSLGRVSSSELGLMYIEAWFRSLTTGQPWGAATAEELASVFDSWSSLSQVQVLRARLDQDILDYLEDVGQYIVGHSPHDKLRLYADLRNAEAQLRLTLQAVQGSAVEVEEARYFGQLLSRVAQIIADHNTALYQTASLAITCDSRSVTYGRPSSLHFTITNQDAGIATQITVRPSVALPSTLSDTEIRLTAIPGGRPSGLSTQLTALTDAPVEVAVRVDYADQSSSNKSTSAVFRLPVSRPERFIHIPKIYIPGKPCRDDDLFVGRSDVFQRILFAVCGQRGDPLVLLHGKRRIGKTSVLVQLENPQSLARYAPALEGSIKALLAGTYVDLEDITADASSNFARAKIINGIASALGACGYDLRATPSPSLGGEDYVMEAQQWLEDATRGLGNYGYRLLVLLDEFDQLLLNRPDDQALYGWLRQLLLRYGSTLSFVYAGADKLTSMMQDRTERLFGMAGAPIQVSPLSGQEARELATKPIVAKAPDFLWQDAALKQLLEACAGHPFYLHYLCDRLLRVCNEEARPELYTTDVRETLAEVLPEMPGIRDEVRSLSPAEQVVLAALAERTSFEQPEATAEEVLHTTQKHDVPLASREVFEALQHLVSLYAVHSMTSIRGERFSFALPLVREYLRQRGVRSVALGSGLL